MAFSIVVICLTFLVYGCVDSSGENSDCECETCHEYIERLTPRYCSREKKFVLGLNAVSWYQAVENCEIKGYKLASIKSQRETDNLLAYIKKQGFEDGSFWLSGTDQHEEGKFLWWTSPEANFEVYTNWYPGQEPSNLNNDENCVHIWEKGTWNDRRCYDNLFYVCEYTPCRE